MDSRDFEEKLDAVLSENVKKIVISNPVGKVQKFRRVDFAEKSGYFMENAFTEKQSFTKNIKKEDLKNEIMSFSQDFKQFNFFLEDREYMIKVSKDGKVFLVKMKSQGKLKVNAENNRQKNYILQEGEIIEPLIDMGIYTKDGKIVKSMYDKYKQINRFIELIDDYIKESNLDKINIVDFGCGKSYLTFVVYYYFKYIRKIDVNIVGLDLKEDVIKKCNETAKKYGYSNLKFELGNINGYKPNMDIDMVITLHACDTATDYALFNAINWKVKMIFSVPCCQHEVNKEISSTNLPIITRYGIVKERISANFTDIIRCNLLKAMSYNVDLIEFIDFDHTPKNLLIRASLTKIPLAERKKYLKEVMDLMKEFNFSQTLFKLLENNLPC